ncbi:lipopolysaccharide biosynthesis protein [Nocardioides coralli]|uniref:lipopolysaccharide biosynthesis protein n=1 Tax=Nocardioides coralli TaxID=2872154 RepID=UPI001CA38E4D|nr:polysaccharide biosynthesis protein [Nocardioides coralli]QZY27907.1 polysaccharide biosynthesis protein [Nocardioides coralli]
MTTAGTAGRAARGGAQIAGAMFVMNVATYGYTVLAARLLGPGSYGGFAAVMNLLLVVSVVALALQATAARRISADVDHVAQIERGVLQVSWYAALALGGVLLLLFPVVERVLRLDSSATALLVAATAVPLTAMGGQAGVLQGERRWRALGAVYVAAGVPRLLIGVSLLAWQPSEFLAVLAVGVGALAPVATGWWLLRPQRTTGAEADRHRGTAILRESLANSQALLAYFALSNLDIVVARNVLGGYESGLYAGGLILTKAMLFLPQFVVVVAFPSMVETAQRASTLSRSLGVIAGLGALGTLGCALLPELALVFIGGGEFASILDRLWLFALLGTVLAMLQLLVYSVLARQGRRSSVLLWLALTAMLVVGSTAETLAGLVVRVIVVDATLLAVLLALSAWLLRRDASTPQPTGSLTR